MSIVRSPLSLPLSLRRLRQTAGGWRAGRLRHDHQREKREARGEEGVYPEAIYIESDIEI